MAPSGTNWWVAFAPGSRAWADVSFRESRREGAPRPIVGSSETKRETKRFGALTAAQAELARTARGETLCHLGLGLAGLLALSGFLRVLFGV